MHKNFNVKLETKEKPNKIYKRKIIIKHTRCYEQFNVMDVQG